MTNLALPPDDLPGDVPAPPVDFMAKIRADREAMQAETLEERFPIPTWQGRLVGWFSPASTQEKAEMGERAKERARASQSKVVLLEGAAFDRIATTCRRLEYDGKQVAGSTDVSGWTAEFAALLDLGEEASVEEVARKACGSPKTDEFTSFFTDLVNWQSSPRPRSQTDPFGLG